MAPPPMPNRPARNPDSAPTATSSSTSSDNSETPSPAVAIPVLPSSRVEYARVHESCFRYTSHQRPSTLSMPTIAKLIHKYEPSFANGRFGRCADCFDFENRIRLPRPHRGSLGGPANRQSRHDRQDRTTAFAASTDLSLH